jgi:hypothetical protein
MSAVSKAQAAGAGPGAAGLPPLPASFPPGVDPATYRLGEVERLLREAAYFSIFSVASRERRNRPILWSQLLPFTVTAVEVNEDLHRFEIETELGTTAAGLGAANRLGASLARVRIRWTPIPQAFRAAPDREPPPTLLNPFRSQRFCMLDGELQFHDGAGSGFRAFGAGRTFPAPQGGGGPRLYLGAVVDALEGLGRFKGLKATLTVNGSIEPPHGLALHLVLRVVDPERRLEGSAAIAPIEPVAEADPEAVYLPLLGEVDPERPTTLLTAPDGRMLGSHVHERLRLVRLRFEAREPEGLSSETTVGPVVGSLAGRLYFQPFGAPTGAPIPFQTRGGVFRFAKEGGAEIGTVRGDVVEGRAFPTELPGAPMPVFRFGGFGPLLGGTGALAGASGMLALNAVVSVFPRTLSNLYVLRIVDRERRLRAALGDLGS